MKKFIPLLLIVFLLFTSCKMDNNKEDQTSGSGDVTEVTDESTTVPDATQLENVAGNLSTKKVIWGPGKIADHQPPTDPVKLDELYSQYNSMFLNGNEKTILLTFDEGYENGFTPSILDTLKEKNVHAMFFVTYDFAKDNHDLIRRMIDEGHTVGNHTYRHKTMDEIDLQTATQEVKVLHDYIKDNFGYTMTYFRFPKGEFSESSLSLVKELGYKSVFWSFAYADWDTSKPVEETQALSKITSSTHSGAIFLLHAVSPTNAAILSTAIDNIIGQGYHFAEPQDTV